MATGGPLAWGLCYNHEMSPSQSYCDDSYKYTYPCTPGAEYYGRGAIPIYWYACTFYIFIIVLLFKFQLLDMNLPCNFYCWYWLIYLSWAGKKLVIVQMIDLIQSFCLSYHYQAAWLINCMVHRANATISIFRFWGSRSNVFDSHESIFFDRFDVLSSFTLISHY